MSRYIKVDALEQHKFVSWTVPEFFNEMSLEQQAYQLGWNNAIEAIMENEPTADVVEVVRCKDCKHAEIQDYAPPSCRYCCKYSALYHAKNFYCSMGERREDERLNKQTGCD